MPVTPTNGYCTGDELKGYISMPTATTTHDARLEDAINTASRAIDSFCQRRFYVDGSVSARVFTPASNTLVHVNDFSTVTGLVVKTDTTGDGTYDTTWTSADYQVEPLNGIEGGIEGWPYYRLRAIETLSFPVSTRATVEVTAKWGWAAVPTAVLSACLILATELYKRGDAPFGVAGVNDFGLIRIREDSRVTGLLNPYRRYPVNVL